MQLAKRYFKPSLIASALSLFAISLQASVVRSDVDYQYFRDFAENKGKFSVGASNIAVFDKTGKQIGTMLNGVPMIDFSVINRDGGYATLIGSQYLTSVQHNGGYMSVEFGYAGKNSDAGYYAYQLVDRNNYPTGQFYANGAAIHPDYHIPRLNKLVTEVAPAAVADVGTDATVYLDANRYPALVRAGSGKQGIRAADGTYTSAGATYAYLTGGNVYVTAETLVDPKSSETNKQFTGIFRNDNPVYTNDPNTPMNSYPDSGDSGSSLWAYDAQQSKWVSVGTLIYNTGSDGSLAGWGMHHPDFIAQKQAEDVAGTITNSVTNAVFHWQVEGNSSTIASDSQRLTVDLKDEAQADLVYEDATNRTQGYRPALNHGKTVIFEGNQGVLNLTSHINQGAGALYFENDFTVKGIADTTSWLGAGVSVAADKTVQWQVHNPAGDRLSKIGAGTLLVNGKGANQGDISVGDGTVILAQQADSRGQKQAFNQVGIVSGRSTVVLEDAEQVDPNQIYFGFRGGRLDVNGNDLNFNYIKNVDEGAVIVNHNDTQATTVNISQRTFTEADLVWGEWNQVNKDIYTHQVGSETYYLQLKQGGIQWSYMPYTPEDNGNWTFLSTNRDEAVQKVLAQKNATVTNVTYNGIFGETDAQKTNGKLNIHYQPTDSSRTLTLTGSMALNGEFKASNGAVLFSGRPTPHAREMNSDTDVSLDTDWINRTFNATQIVASQNAAITIGRNVTKIQANFTASESATLNLGYQNGVTPICERSDYTGETACRVSHLNETVMATIPTTAIAGDVQLAGNSQLTVGKAHLTGSVQADTSTKMNLTEEARWTMTGDSEIGSLNAEKGAQIDLNSAADAGSVNQYNTLTINGDLTGEGQFNYFTNVSALQGDKVVVKGNLAGTQQLYVQDSGTEPTSAEKLTLLQTDPSKTNTALVALSNANQVVDIGAWRYHLINENGAYRLYSPTLDEKIRNEALAKAEAERLAAEQAAREALAKAEAERLAAEQAAREALAKAEAERLAAEQAAQEALAKAEAERLAAEQVARDALAKAEAERLAAEQAAQEALAKAEAERLAAEQAAREALAKAEAERLAAEQAAREALAKSEVERQKALLAQQQQAALISRYANTGLSELSAQVNALNQINRAVNRQLLTERKHEFDVWLNRENSRSTHSSSQYRAYQQENHLWQLGVEKALPNRVRAGLLLSQSRSQNHFDGTATGKGRMTAVSVYAKKTWDNGVWGSLDVTYGKAKNRITQDGYEVKFNRHLAGVGVNLGKKIDIGQGFIQPSAGVRYDRLSGVSYLLNGARVNSGSLGLFSYNLGVKVGQSFLFNGVKISPELSHYFVDSSRQTFPMQVNNSSLNQKFGRYLQHEIGLSAEAAGWEVAGSAGIQHGNELEKQTYFNLRLGYYW